MAKLTTDTIWTFIPVAGPFNHPVLHMFCEAQLTGGRMFERDGFPAELFKSPKAFQVAPTARKVHDESFPPFIKLLCAGRSPRLPDGRMFVADLWSRVCVGNRTWRVFGCSPALSGFYDRVWSPNYSFVDNRPHFKGCRLSSRDCVFHDRVWSHHYCTVIYKHLHRTGCRLSSRDSPRSTFSAAHVGIGSW